MTVQDYFVSNSILNSHCFFMRAFCSASLGFFAVVEMHDLIADDLIGLVSLAGDDDHVVVAAPRRSCARSPRGGRRSRAYSLAA